MNLAKRFAFGQNQFHILDEHFVSEVDHTDNVGQSQHPNMINAAITAFNATWDSDESEQDCFNKAVFVAAKILAAQIETADSKFAASHEVSKIIKESTNGILILDNYMPWQVAAMKDGNIKLCVFPSNRGGWNVQQLNNETNDGYRASFPQEWINGNYPDGVNFVHKAGFMLACDTKERAVEVALEVVKLNEE